MSYTQSERWPVVGRCAAKVDGRDCDAVLTLDADGFTLGTADVDGFELGCEHAGKRNRTEAEWRQLRLDSIAGVQTVVGKAAHPEPEVRARPALEAELPTGARQLVKAAIAAGWIAAPAYARGTLPGQAHPVDSIVLRLTRGSERAVACWTDGKADGAWVVRPEFRKVGVRELKAQVQA